MVRMRKSRFWYGDLQCQSVNGSKNANNRALEVSQKAIGSYRSWFVLFSRQRFFNQVYTALCCAVDHTTPYYYQRTLFSYCCAAAYYNEKALHD